MTVRPKNLFPNERIERKAEKRLDELAHHLSHPLTLPIPIDRLAEDLLGLNFLWDEIQELPGETILGGLDVESGLITLNAVHQDLFIEKPGLERSTKGHELGHWDLLLDHAMRGQNLLPGLVPERAQVTRRSRGRNLAVLAGLLRVPFIADLAWELQKRADLPDEARIVNRYAAAISMPRAMIRAEARRIDLTDWDHRYALARRFGVTISALNVRLDQLNLSHVADRDHIHSSKAVAARQLTFD